MKFFYFKSFISVAGLFLTPFNVKAGFDSFTFLEEINGWRIERSYDNQKKEVSCRASIANDGTWFSARRRLDRNDELIIPSFLLGKERPREETIEIIKKKLKICRASLLYSQFQY